MEEKQFRKSVTRLNIRDLADMPQLTVLANLESHNADLIRQSLPPKERLIKLRDLAITQLRSLRNINYAFPIESPHIIPVPANSFEANVKGILSAPTPPKDNKKQ